MSDTEYVDLKNRGCGLGTDSTIFNSCRICFDFTPIVQAPAYLPIVFLFILTLVCSKNADADVNSSAWAIDSIADTDGSVDVARGSVESESGVAYSGLQSIKLSYFGAGQNGYARLKKYVDLVDGDTATFSAAFFLPFGFKQKQQGQVALMRWDNFVHNPHNTVQGGLVMHSDGSLVMVLQRLGAEPYYSELTPRVSIEEGRWVDVTVTQTISSDPDLARNELRINGEVVAKSNVKNSFGQSIQRLRVGIVSIDENSQFKDLSLYVDELRCC